MYPLGGCGLTAFATAALLAREATDHLGRLGSRRAASRASIGPREVGLHGAEALSAIAEVGLGLTGFTGILVALGRSPEVYSRPEVLRLLLLLVSSLGAVFLALFPLALHECGIGEPLCWRLSSALLAFFTAVSLASLGHQIQRHRAEFGRLFSATVFRVVAGGSLAAVAAQIANLAGLGALPRAGPFLFGLLWLLFVASIQFIRILFVRHAE